MDCLSISYIYVHLLVIYDFGVLIPSMSFQANFLETVDVSPFQVMPNVSGIIRAFQFIWQWLEVSYNVGVFLTFYGIKLALSSGWIKLFSLPRRTLLKPHSNPYIS